MTLNIPSGFCNVTFQYRLDGNSLPSFWSIGLDLAGPLDVTQFDDAFTFLSGTNLGPSMASGNFLTGFIMEDEVHRFEQYFSSPGTAGFSGPPANVCLLFHKTTGLKGHKFHGLNYIPGAYVDQGDVLPNGTIVSATHDTLEVFFGTFLADLVDAISADGGVVLHQGTTAPTPILQFNLDAKVATQRRRLRPAT